MYLEFGVYTGTTINHIAKLIDDTVYGFDSFKGLPENWRSGYGEGTFRIDGLPEVEKNVKLIPGWFDETLPEFLEDHKENVAFIHVDSDLYSSAKIIFTYLKDRIVSGTIIVFDEYFNYPGWRDGEYKAFKEFINETGKKFRYLAYVEISEQVAVEII